MEPSLCFEGSIFVPCEAFQSRSMSSHFYQGRKSAPHMDGFGGLSEELRILVAEGMLRVHFGLAFRGDGTSDWLYNLHKPGLSSGFVIKTTKEFMKMTFLISSPSIPEFLRTVCRWLSFYLIPMMWEGRRKSQPRSAAAAKVSPAESSRRIYLPTWKMKVSLL